MDTGGFSPKCLIEILWHPQTGTQGYLICIQSAQHTSGWTIFPLSQILVFSHRQPTTDQSVAPSLNSSSLPVPLHLLLGSSTKTIPQMVPHPSQTRCYLPHNISKVLERLEWDRNSTPYVVGMPQYPKVLASGSYPHLLHMPCTSPMTSLDLLLGLSIPTRHKQSKVLATHILIAAHLALAKWWNIVSNLLTCYVNQTYVMLQLFAENLIWTIRCMSSLNFNKL